MTEAMPFLQKYDITFLRPPTIRRGDFIWGCEASPGGCVFIAAGGFAAHTPSFSRAASFRQVQNTAMACSSSATGGREGAMRMLLSWGSLP